MIKNTLQRYEASNTFSCPDPQSHLLYHCLRGLRTDFPIQLCALSTVAAGVAGLTFGFKDNVEPSSPLSTKRKAPSSAGSFPYFQGSVDGDVNARRIVSQPLPETTKLFNDGKRPQRSFSRSLLRRKPTADIQPSSSNVSASTVSAESSVSRHKRFRSRTGDETSDDKEGNGPSPSWLRRLSMMSSNSGNATPSRPDTPSVAFSQTLMTPSFTAQPESARPDPNKLVKRSLSHRALSSTSNRLSILRRPATSHQRIEASQSTQARNHVHIDKEIQNSTWRPYFINTQQTLLGGYRPRKRHTSGAGREQGVRTVSWTPGTEPSLLLGDHVAPRADLDDIDDTTSPIVAPTPLLHRKKRLPIRADRRAFTEPVRPTEISLDDAGGNSGTSLLSPISRVSPFEVHPPLGTPAFSDPTTANSDHVFTDDDSMDFQSDTAYDSLATRATASSHSGLRGLHIDRVFGEAGQSEPGTTLLGLEDLIRGGSLDKPFGTASSKQYDLPSPYSTLANNHKAKPLSPGRQSRLSMTPERQYSDSDDSMATPVARKIGNGSIEHASSPPSMVTPKPKTSPPVQEIEQRIDALSIIEDEWRLEDSENFDHTIGDDSELPGLMAAQDRPMEPLRMKSLHQRFAQDHRSNEKRTSLFDWSEQQKLGSEPLDGSSPRPKTVHGKQAAEPRGSRASGRRGSSALHLRSQSVPVSRDNTLDQDPSRSAAKFGTWGLGHKPVSEEWGDDFEFDDMDGAEEADVANSTLQTSNFGSVKGLKVPDAIIDRQASVHGQFGHVQEFMLLVEELKHLRVQGSMLQLLDGHSKPLWADAESIINLATLNDEDETRRTRSSTTRTSFDTFDELPTTPQQIGLDENDNLDTEATGRRSISSPTYREATR